MPYIPLPLLKKLRQKRIEVHYITAVRLISVIINNDIKIHGLREEKIYVQKIISCLDEVNELNDLSRKRFDLNAVSAK